MEFLVPPGVPNPPYNPYPPRYFPAPELTLPLSITGPASINRGSRPFQAAVRPPAASPQKPPCCPDDGLAIRPYRPHAARISDALICLHAGPVARRVRAGDQRRARAVAAEQAGAPRPGRRPQPDPDDEAAAGPARRARRHQRAGRAGLHQARRRPAAHRRPGPARGPARLGRRGSSTSRSSTTPNGSSRTRSSGCGAPSAGRCARPTRPRTCPRCSPRCARPRSSAARTATGRSRSGSSTSAPTRPSSARASCWPRSGSRYSPARAARTRRWRGGWVTGRWPPPAAVLRLEQQAITEAGIGLTAVGAEHFVAAEAEEYLRGRPADRAELRARPPPSPRSTAIPSPTSAAPRTTSGTWSPSSPPARCAVLRAGPPRGREHAMTMRVAVTVNGTEYSARRRAAAAAHPLPARRARPDRQPLGLRHVELRQLRGVAGRHGRSRRARYSRRWPTAVRSAPWRTWSGTAGSTRCSRGSSSATACSAVSARRA